MIKHILTLMVFALAAFLVASGSYSNDEPEIVVITVTPKVLIMGDQGVWVTVHTDVPLSSVDTGLELYLDNIEASVVKADACGNIVGKFDQEIVKEKYEGIAPTEATLTLKGTYKTGGEFTGSDTITVKNEGKNN